MLQSATALDNSGEVLIGSRMEWTDFMHARRPDGSTHMMERQASPLLTASSSHLIENSWKRCLHQGMIASRRSQQSLLTPTELLHQQQKHFDLRWLALC